MIDTVVLKDSNVIAFFTEEALLVKIDGKKDTSVAKEYHVSAYPTLVMIDTEGNEVDRLVGYLPPKPFLKTWREFAQGIGTLEDLVNRAQTGTDRSLYMEIAEKYKYRGGTDDANSWYAKVVADGDPLDSLSGEARLAGADMLRRAKDFTAALTAYQSIAKDFGELPAGIDAQMASAHCQRYSEDFEGALGAYNTIMEKYKGQPAEYDAAIYIAIAYRDMGDTAKAIEHFIAFPTKYPKADPRALGYCAKQVKVLTAPPVVEETK